MNQVEKIEHEVVGVPVFEVISRTGDEYSAYDGRGNLIYRSSDVKDEEVEKLSWRSKYFAQMGQRERNLVSGWHFDFEPQNTAQQVLGRIVGDALAIVNYDYEIAIIDPSMDENGKLFYHEEAAGCGAMNGFEWERKAKEFAPEFNSRLANLYELFLWYAYCIAAGNKTIEDICDVTYEVTTYSEWISDGRPILPTGRTYKIVKNNTTFAMCGGRFFTSQTKFSMSDVGYVYFPEGKMFNGSGIVVLKK